MNIYLDDKKIAYCENIELKHPKENEIKGLIAQHLSALGIFSESQVDIHYNQFIKLSHSEQVKKRILSEELLPISKNARKKILWHNRLKKMMKS